MRVLYTSFIEASERFGGGLVILQTLSSLSDFSEIDFIGLEYNKEDFKKYKINIAKKKIVHPSTSFSCKIINTLLYGATSSYYTSWKEALKSFNPNDYDFMYMDFTRHSFVAKWAHDNGLPLIIRAHNAEFDYAKSIFYKKKNLKNFLKLLVSKYNEKKCVKYATKIILITEHEKQRFIDLYGDEKKYDVLPVCVKKFTKSAALNKVKPYILITGSLWFGPNADGVIWFLKNVWTEIQDRVGKDFDLVIAGARPNEEIKTLSKTLSNIRLFDTPKDIEPFYVDASLYIAPIFYGAGMKVKIAEALSCGLRVIATSHALTGYEAVYDYTFCANNVQEFINIIQNEINVPVSNSMKQNIINIYNKNYSLDSSVSRLKKITSTLVKK